MCRCMSDPYNYSFPVLLYLFKTKIIVHCHRTIESKRGAGFGSLRIDFDIFKALCFSILADPPQKRFRNPPATILRRCLKADIHFDFFFVMVKKQRYNNIIIKNS